jgi:hypothetical protein
MERRSVIEITSSRLPTSLWENPFLLECVSIKSKPYGLATMIINRFFYKPNRLA